MALPDASGVTYIVDGPAQSGILDLYHATHKAHAQQRLALPFIQSIDRYTVKGEDELFINIYNVKSLKGYTEPSYAEVEANPPEEEKKTVEAGGLKSEERKIMLLEHEVTAPGAGSGPGAYLLSTTTTVSKSDIPEIENWVKSEHLGLQSKVPGFRRARAFKQIVPNPALKEDEAEILILYEYEKENGINGAEAKAAWETDAAKQIRPKLKGGVRREADFLEELKN